MDPKQKAVENVKSCLDKRVEKNNHKLLDYRDREKVYGFRYENKKDVIHAENELSITFYEVMQQHNLMTID